MNMEVSPYEFAYLLCPPLENSNLSLHDHVSAKKGFSSLLYLQCSSCKHEK